MRVLNYCHALRRQTKRYRSEESKADYPGFIFVEIDSLSEPDSRRAIREGQISDGNGLLAVNGYSRFNMFSTGVVVEYSTESRETRT